MCGRITLRREKDELESALRVSLPTIHASYNIAPSSQVLALRSRLSGADGEQPVKGVRADLVRWNFRPSWMQDLRNSKIGPQKNARIESLATSRMYAPSLRRRRCIVIADGFYEWPRRADGRGNDRERPHFIRFRDDRIFGLAGIWTTFTPDGRPDDAEDTLAIITMPANSLLERVGHHRHPAIIDQQRWDSWLDPENEDADRSVGLLEPTPSRMLEAWQVPMAANKASNNSSAVLQQVGDLLHVE